MKWIMLCCLINLSYARVEPKVEVCEDKNKDEVSSILSAAALADNCPKARPEDIKGLCGYICNKYKDKKNGTEVYPFEYQSIIFKLSCTSRNDSDEVMNRKIQVFWKKHEKMLECDAGNFNLGKGDLIKYGVANYFDEFIFDVTTWGINLNKIDPADGKTVLDYVKEEMVKKKGTPLETTLKSYYFGLKEAGAKHKKDL